MCGARPLRRENPDVLQQEGRVSNQALTDGIGPSPQSFLRLVRAPKPSGITAGYRAYPEVTKLEPSLVALIHFSMNCHTPERIANFETRISDLPQVLECLLIAGQQVSY